MTPPNSDPSPVPTDFDHAGVPVPHDMEEYLSYRGGARFVAVRAHYPGDPVVTDGYTAHAYGDFASWDNDAGSDFVRKVAEASDRNDLSAEHPVQHQNLTVLLDSVTDHDLVTSPEDRRPPRDGLVFDLAERRVYVGEWDAIESFLRDVNDSPKSASLVEQPDDVDSEDIEEAIVTQLEDAFEALTDESISIDLDRNIVPDPPSEVEKNTEDGSPSDPTDG